MYQEFSVPVPVCSGSNGAHDPEEDDVFQCGKCKRQFTALEAFMDHKRQPCRINAGAALAIVQQQVSDLDPTTVTAEGQGSATTYSSVGVTSIPHIVLSETEFLSLPTLDSLGQWGLPGTFLEPCVSVPQSLGLQLGVGSQSAILNVVAPCSGELSGEDGTSGTRVTYSLVTQIPSVASAREQTTISIAETIPDVQQSEGEEKESPASKVSEPLNGVLKRSPNMKKEQKVPLNCIHCDKKFQKKFDLQQHLRSHTGERPFQCIVCGRGFSQKSNVKKHMATHKVWPQGLSNTLPKVPVSVKTTTDDSLQVEIKNQSDENAKRASEEPDMEVCRAEKETLEISIDNSYVCQYCSASFPSFCKLKTHLKTHKSQQVYRCVVPNCGKTFAELTDFLGHTSTHENEMNYRCHVCSKQFATLYDLGVHQYSHTLHPNQVAKTVPRFYQCTKCMSKYSTPEALEHHMSTSSHSFSCQHCNKVFPCERSLRRHLPTHGSLASHTCPVCKKTFKTEHYVRVHLLVHSKERPHTCTVAGCTASFSRKDRLKRHALIHQPVKRYKCPFKRILSCNKEFCRGDKLKAHIIAHSGLRPFRCQKCPRIFSRRLHLNEHVRMHRDDDGVKLCCQKCLKEFKDKDTMAGHDCLEPQQPLSPERIVRPVRRLYRPRILRNHGAKRRTSMATNKPPKQGIPSNTSAATALPMLPPNTGLRRSKRPRKPKEMPDYEQEQLPARAPSPLSQKGACASLCQTVYSEQVNSV